MKVKMKYQKYITVETEVELTEEEIFQLQNPPDNRSEDIFYALEKRYTESETKYISDSFVIDGSGY